MNEGLYEQIINKLIRSKLNSLEHKKYYIQEKTIDKSEASIILSRYLSNTIRIAFEQIKGDDKLDKQISISNSIIQLIAKELENDLFQEDLIQTEAKILTAIYSKINPKFSDFAKYLKEITPYTRLSQSELFTGNNAGVSLESELRKEILSSDKINFLVSFIKWSGIRIFEKELRQFTKKGGQLRIITTSYMGATDLKAVEFLSELENTEIKVSYNTDNERLHAKAYLFIRNTGFDTGYIGSSNMSRSALTNGLEWNVKITSLEVKQLMSKFKKTFDTYWEDNEFETFIKDKHSEKLQKALKAEKHTVSDGFSTYFDIKPFPFQNEILENLKTEREVHNRHKNLVVAATGTGKTIISAFDFKNFQKNNINAKLLFITHRKEILVQAISTYRAVLKDNNFGELWVDNYKPSNYSVIFASIQSFSRSIEDLQLSKDYYDFIVIDEVHHISASSYRPITNAFDPKVLLGLTATPERMDGANILDDFCNVIAAEIRLPEALNRKLLTPFQYFGITDNVDLSNLQWKNGKYVPGELTKIYTANDLRVNSIINNIENYLHDKNDTRALGFCVTKDHAKYMAEKFTLAGLKANYIVSGSSNREEIRRQFQNKQINYLFVVDIFNEGVDIPEIDTVLFLRPTESLTVFLQQLGRGLRLSEEKEILTVLDFVSNSRPEYDFEGKFRALIGKTNSSVINEIEKDFPHLPLGCSVVLEKKAKDVILNNIKNATNYNKNILIKKIQNYEHQTTLPLTLENFISVYNIPIQSIYKSYTWSNLKALAGKLPNYNKVNDKRIFSAIKNKLLSTNSYSYFSFILKLARSDFRINLSTLSDEEKTMCLMLHYDVWGEAKINSTLKNSILEIGKNKDLQKELIELLNILIDRIDFIESEINLPYSQPLRLHSRYTRDQILIAFRFSSFEKKSSNREGVAENKILKTELLFIDLVKSENDFSPTTLYNDYAISETVFHWQSQNATTSDKGKGLSYINHLEKKKKILLFVRERKKDKYGNTMGYVFIGEGKIQSYEGNKPMDIKWELSEPMPNYIWKASAKMAVG